MDPGARHLVRAVELYLDELAEARRVVVAQGARVAERLEQRVRREDLPGPAREIQSGRAGAGDSIWPGRRGRFDLAGPARQIRSFHSRCGGRAA